ncbi:MAG: ZIP family metal transporter [Candidatus Nanoarchaeia archaeon]
MELVYQILLATIGVSLISLIGVFITSSLKKEPMHLMVSFAAGALLGAAFLDLIPEGLEHVKDDSLFFYYLLGGFLLFFVLEKFIYWYHCHEGKCHKHPFSYLSLIGDIMHNFLDGIIIAVAFMTNATLGLTTTLAIISHEIPQEIGDYFILRAGGFSRKNALLANFFTALTAVLGGMLAYSFFGDPEWAGTLVAFAAGGFVYIAAADLVPEIHKVHGKRESALHFVFLVLGIAVIGAAKVFAIH